MERGKKEKEIVGDGTNLINKSNPFSRDHAIVNMYVFTHLLPKKICLFLLAFSLFSPRSRKEYANVQIKILHT